MFFKKTLPILAVLILLANILQFNLLRDKFLTTEAAQSANLDTNMTSYIGSTGNDIMSATAIGNDDTAWFGGSNFDLTQNYGKTPINILGGGSGVLLHFANDGKTLNAVLRFPNEVKDLSINKINNNLAVIGDFGLVYLNTSNYSTKWSKVLPKETADLAANLDEGIRVDIGRNGTIGSLYTKRVALWDEQGNNLTTQPSGYFQVGGRLATDIAVIDANNSVVVIGETQKNGSPCVAWRAPWMRSYTANGSYNWVNYDFSQSNLKGTNGTTTWDYCPDAMPKRMTLGGDNNLYMVAESAGGNPVFNVDPRNFNPADNSTRLQNQGKTAGGDSHNNTSNMSSQHVSFMMKYEPITGDVLKQQVWVGRLPSTVANTLLPQDIAVNESGIISLVGKAGAYFPDRLSQVQKINGEIVPDYNSGSTGDGYYLELLPDMKTRIRSSIFKKNDESWVNSVSSKGGKRIISGKLIGTAGQIMTKNPIQSVSGGGNQEGYMAAWGFGEVTQDYSISATRTPATGSIPLSGNLSTKYTLAYTGSQVANDMAVKFTIPQGLNYNNELYDGFSCTIVSNNKVCTKNVLASQWTNGYNQDINVTVPAVLEGSQNNFNRDIIFQIAPINNTVGESDSYPLNNISTVTVVLDPTVPVDPDYKIDPQLKTTGNIALGGFVEIDVPYSYTGPNSNVTDKKLVVTIPEGLQHDSRSGMQCTISGTVQTCTKNLLQTDFRYGSSYKVYLQAKNPTSGINPKTVIFDLTTGNTTSVDNNPSNHTNKTVSITINPTAVNNENYGVAFGQLPSNNVYLGQAISVPVNIKLNSNTPPVSNRLSITIPVGFSYNYVTNNGFTCATNLGVQTCSKVINSALWSTATGVNGLDIPLNLVADSTFSTPAAKVISASLLPFSGNTPVDSTANNNSAQLTLNLQTTAAQSSSSSSSSPISSNSSSSAVSSSSNISSSSLASSLSSSSVILPNSSSSSSLSLSSNSSSSSVLSSSNSSNSSISSSQISSSSDSSSSSSVLSSSSSNLVSSYSSIMSFSSPSSNSSSSSVLDSSSSSSLSSNEVSSLNSSSVSSTISSSISSSVVSSSSSSLSSSSNSLINSSNLSSSSSSSSSSSMIVSSSSNSSSNSSSYSSVQSTVAASYNIRMSDGKNVTMDLLNTPGSSINCPNLFSYAETLFGTDRYIEFKADCSKVMLRTYWTDLDATKSYEFKKYNSTTNQPIANFPATVKVENVNGKNVVTSYHEVVDNQSGDSDTTTGKITDPFTLVAIATQTSSSSASSVIAGLNIGTTNTGGTNAALATNTLSFVSKAIPNVNIINNNSYSNNNSNVASSNAINNNNSNALAIATQVNNDQPTNLANSISNKVILTRTGGSSLLSALPSLISIIVILSLWSKSSSKVNFNLD
jgi:hypothetical protein